MTDLLNDAYGLRIGRELREMADRAIQPYDPAAIAHSVAVGSRARGGRRIDFGLGWLRGQRPLVLAFVILTTLLLLALGASVAQRPSAPLTFAPGSIAFERDGDLYIAGPDGGNENKVGDAIEGTGISKFAFSPDRQYLAFVRTIDPVTSAETLGIASADGTILDIYTYDGSGSEPTAFGLTFGWAPDSRRLAVNPGASAEEIAIIGMDGKRLGGLTLPAGTSMRTAHRQLFATLAWSPDSVWLAVASKSGGDVSDCEAADDPYAVCYILLATDGSGAQSAFDDPSGYFAWAPDSRAAVTHWAPGTVEIRPTDGSAPTLVALPESFEPYDGLVLAWSPDGTRLVVAAGNGAAESTLFVIDGDSTVDAAPIGGPFSIGANGQNVTDVAWSIDGQRLLFQGVPGGGVFGIWSMDLGGGPPTELVDANGAQFDIADGRPW